MFIYYILLLAILIWNIRMSPILTIPLYKLVCNLSYIDNEFLIIRGKEICNLFIICDITSISIISSSNWELLINNNVLTNNSYHDIWISDSNIYIEILETCEIDSFIIPDKCEFIEIKFISNVSNISLIEFVQLQNNLILNFGETGLAFSRIYNPTNLDLTGISMYFVYPNEVSIYINKIQCFCFDLIRISRNETIELPILFYFDSELYINNIDIDKLIYISYIFFIQ